MKHTLSYKANLNTRTPCDVLGPGLKKYAIKNVQFQSRGGPAGRPGRLGVSPKTVFNKQCDCGVSDQTTFLSLECTKCLLTTDATINVAAC